MVAASVTELPGLDLFSWCAMVNRKELWSKVHIHYELGTGPKIACSAQLSIEDWIRQLEQASARKTELTAAVIGAASKGLD